MENSDWLNGGEKIISGGMIWKSEQNLQTPAQPHSLLI
jgi:hypothetical protein